MDKKIEKARAAVVEAAKDVRACALNADAEGMHAARIRCNEAVRALEEAEKPEPVKDPTPEERARAYFRWHGNGGNWETMTKEIRDAERAAERRALGRSIDYIAAYQMALPVRLASDVDAWKRGLIQSLNETFPKD